MRSFQSRIVLIFAAVIAQFMSSYAGFKNLRLETVLFSILLDLILGNLIRLPAWLRSGVQTELYVKIGLILPGATILFNDILTAGYCQIINANEITQKILAPIKIIMKHNMILILLMLFPATYGQPWAGNIINPL